MRERNKADSKILIHPSRTVNYKKNPLSCLGRDSNPHFHSSSLTIYASTCTYTRKQDKAHIQARELNTEKQIPTELPRTGGKWRVHTHVLKGSLAEVPTMLRSPISVAVTVTVLSSAGLCSPSTLYRVTANS